MDQDSPAFEVHSGSKVFRIWADGRISGFPNDYPTIVINRIPCIAADDRAVGLVFAKSMTP